MTMDDKPRAGDDDAEDGADLPDTSTQRSGGGDTRRSVDGGGDTRRSVDGGGDTR